MNKYFFKMFSFVRPYRFTYYIGTVLYSSQLFGFSLITAIVMSRVMAALLSGEKAGVVYAVILMLALFAGFITLVGFGTCFYVLDSNKATRELKRRLFRAYVSRSVEESLKGHSGEGIASINTEADTAANVISNALAPVLSCVIAIVFSSVFVFAIDYRLGLASLAAGGLAFFAQSRFAKPLGELGKKQLAVNASSVKSVSNTFSGAMAIRAFNMQDRALISFDRENAGLKAISFKRAFIAMWQNLFTTVQGWGTLVIVFALGGWLVATGRLDFPSLMMAPPMCLAISEGISQIGSAWAGLQAPIAAAERVFGILEGESAGRESSDAGIGAKSKTEKRMGAKTKTRTGTGNATGKAIEADATVAPCDGEDTTDNGYALRVSKLSFKYSGAEENTLSDIDLKVNENEMIAFVGASGSGKSTLLKAIIGMYDRSDFDITLGGSSFTGSDPIAWRKRFAYVDQSCKLFDMTVVENIALGAGGAASDELIREAAALASADVFIEALPDGYDTSCGEKGASLSGGQKQRIAIARALARQAPILIFDEATSALDAESEKSIMETIENLRKSHTVLITTHNLHNITSADRIVVMDKGRVSEIGTHNELMKNPGVYSALYNREG